MPFPEAAGGYNWRRTATVRIARRSCCSSQLSEDVSSLERDLTSTCAPCRSKSIIKAVSCLAAICKGIDLVPGPQRLLLLAKRFRASGICLFLIVNWSGVYVDFFSSLSSREQYSFWGLLGRSHRHPHVPNLEPNLGTKSSLFYSAVIAVSVIIFTLAVVDGNIWICFDCSQEWRLICISTYEIYI